MIDSGCRILAATYIRRQAKQLAQQLDGVRAAEDIEFVHRARVATRRLRAALRMFGDSFAPKHVKRWRKAIRQTTAKLGDARDHDVQIEFLCGALSALNTKVCFPGIARILVQLERQRERLQRKVVKAVDRLQAKHVLRDMRRTTGKILRDAASPSADVQTPAARARTERQFVLQLDALLDHQNSLTDPEDRRGHHAMRIAAKRLRYTLEIVRSAHPGRFDEALEATKRVQSLLGDVHDCDVWMEHLDVFAAAERERIVALFGHAGRFGHLQAGIDYLREDRRHHSEDVFRQLVDYWAELGQRQFWERLKIAVREHAEPAGPPQRQPESTSAPPPEAVGPTVADPRAWLPIDGIGEPSASARKSLLTTGS